MADELTAIDVLRAEIARLTEDNQSLAAERDQYRDALETIGEERDQLQAAAKTPDSKDQRIRELEGLIRTGKHRDTFAGAAKAARLREEEVAGLFDLLKANPSRYGLDPKLFDGDEIDAKLFESVFSKERESRGYAFIPDEQEAAGGDAVPDRPTWPESSAIRPTRTPEPVGSGRGPRNTGGDGTIITPEMRANPAFMLNPANRETIYAAAREGRIR